MRSTLLYSLYLLHFLTWPIVQKGHKTDKWICSRLCDVSSRPSPSTSSLVPSHPVGPGLVSAVSGSPPRFRLSRSCQSCPVPSRPGPGHKSHSIPFASGSVPVLSRSRRRISDCKTGIGPSRNRDRTETRRESGQDGKGTKVDETGTGIEPEPRSGPGPDGMGQDGSRRTRLGRTGSGQTRPRRMRPWRTGIGQNATGKERTDATGTRSGRDRAGPGSDGTDGMGPGPRPSPDGTGRDRNDRTTSSLSKDSQRRLLRLL